MSRRISQTIVFAVILAFITPIASTGEAVAQDWSVRRDPFDKRIVARYKRILARNPSDAGALAKLVGLYRRYRSASKLVAEYERALAKKPDSFANNAILGYLHLRVGSKNSAGTASAAATARTYFERAAVAKPKAASVQAALGKLYRRAGEATKARTAYDIALTNTKSKKLKKVALRALADLALDAGDIAAARGYFDKYIALEPRNMQLRIELGDALMNHGETDSAIAVYAATEKKLRSDPARRVTLVARIGQAYEKAGKEDAAVREYRRAIGLVGRGYFLRRELTTRIIDIYRRRQGLPELITYYEKHWPKSRRKHFEWDVLARLFEETGSQERAIAAFRKATKKAPYELDTQRRLITLLENAGRDDEALRQYEQVIRFAPGEPRFQLELAERYWLRGKQKKALALLSKMENRFASDAGVHSAVADLYIRWGKDDRALKVYQRLTRIEPGEVSHLVSLGEQYFQRNKKSKAVATWKKIISKRTAANYARLGEVYADHDMRQEALDAYSRATKMAPKIAAYRKARAQIYSRRRMWKSAIDDWRLVLSLTAATQKANKPLRKEARRAVVRLYGRWGTGVLRRRIAEWKSTFRNSPPDIEAGRYLVEAYMKQHQYAQARWALELLLGIDARDTDSIGTLVDLYRRERKFDKAVALLLKLAKIQPAREREVFTRIAEIKTDAREDDKAIYYVQKALAKSPNDPVAYMRLAERYEAMQDESALQKAMAAYEKTIELDKRNYTAYFRLARLYQRETSTHMKAALLYRRLLQRATDNAILEKAGRKAINLEEVTGTLGELEGVLSPLAFTFGHKKVYRRILVELYARYVPILVARTRRGTDAAGARAKQQHQERLHLKRLGNHGLKPLLEALNDDKDPAQQRFAVAVLGHLGNRGAAAPLIRVALKSAAAPRTRPRTLGTLRPILDLDTRIEALVAAGRLGDPRIIPELIKLTKNIERGMREAAIFGLGRTRDRRAVPPLLSAMGDFNDSVQAQACLALSFSHEKRVVDRMIELVNDKNRTDTTRAACAYSLGVIGDASAVQPLIETLSQGNDEVQRLAAYALGRIGDKRAVSALLAANFNGHEKVRRTVAWSLTRIANPNSKPLPTDSIVFDPKGRSSGGSNTFNVANAIHALGATLATPPLVPSLLVGNDKRLTAGIRDALKRHTDLQIRMLSNLDSHPSRLSLGELTARLEEAPARDRREVLAVLAEIGVRLAGDIAALTKHRDVKVRALALSVLSKIDAKAVVPALIAGISDSRAAVRRAAMSAAALYAKRNPASAGRLASPVATRLEAKSWLERTDAARTLGSFGPSAPAKPLVRALADDFGYVRLAAVVALGEVGGAVARKGLRRATSDSDPGIARAARAALASLEKK